MPINLTNETNEKFSMDLAPSGYLNRLIENCLIPSESAGIPQGRQFSWTAFSKIKLKPPKASNKSQ